ncbi:MAG TPA: hypothetical protein VK176_12910 [Phycisphaerales bacterium]|nr:hypothetical protein [Phycisphaerales bacterium]
MRLMTCAALAAAAIVAAPASATFFSFASDADHTSWTFGGNGGLVTSGNDPFDPQLLAIDDNNGPTFTFLQLEFEASFELSYLGSLPFVGGKATHTYAISGAFAFIDPSTQLPLLVCNFAGGLFSTVGNGGPNPTWGSTASIQAGDDYSVVNYQWFGPADPNLGLYPGQSVGLDTLAYTLTVLNSATGPGVAVDPQTYLPTSQWYSEGSFSGSTNFVPAPGVAVLAGFAGLGLLRRRR